MPRQPSVTRRRPSEERRRRALPAHARAFRRRLLAWYTRHQRPLPWRRTRDPYAILVSEIMLQQTQVARVQEYWTRFLRRYPTVDALAAASADAVHESWSGLGYYARARNLHAAARQVVRDHGGAFPSEPEALRRLPGIGRYTAAAVASIAFDADVGTVDTNVARVLARAFRIRGPKGSAARARRTWNLVNDLLPRGRAGAWNQALMDLGATICTARAPRCPKCPVRTTCPAAGRPRVLAARSRQASRGREGRR
jgi:A/G-specific adenine glycosylase